MKKYEAPEIKITRFSRENIVTASTTSLDAAQAAINQLGATATLSNTAAKNWSELTSISF